MTLIEKLILLAIAGLLATGAYLAVYDPYGHLPKTRCIDGAVHKRISNSNVYEVYSYACREVTQ